MSHFATRCTPPRSSRPLRWDFEPLESRRLLASASIAVPAALDGEASMGDVVNFPDGFGSLWFLDTAGRVMSAANVEGSIHNNSHAVMEFPLAGIPNGSRIDSAKLRYHVIGATGPVEGGGPSLEFHWSAGDGQLTVEEFAVPQGPPGDPFANRVDAGTETGVNTVDLDKAFIQNLIGRASHLKIVGIGGQSVDITTAEGTAATGATPPTLVLTYTPPPQPVPPPAPLPSGTIRGSAFIDTDADGTRDADEVPATKFTVYLDANRNGDWDGDEYATRTDAAGNYRFVGLAAGNYRVRQFVPFTAQSWRLTAPASGFFDITLATNASAAEAPAAFGLATSGVQIYGSVFDDLDGDGTREASEPPFPRRTLFLDQNNNGVFDTDDSSGFLIEEPATTTDAHGNYFFYNLPAGTHRVRVMPQAGARTTSPPNGAHAMTLAVGQVATGKVFGVVADDSVPPPPPPPPPPPLAGSISGVVFEDADSDGTRDAGEQGVADVRVFVDSNKNGRWDEAPDLLGEDELSVFTDSDGSYRLMRINGLEPGLYRVRMDLPGPAWSQTSPATGHDVNLASGQSVTGRNFGVHDSAPPPPQGSISGTVFDEKDRDGVQDPGEAGVGDYLVYLDDDADLVWDTLEKFTRTDDAGHYTLSGLPAGEFRVCDDLSTGWQPTRPATAYHAVTLSADQAVTGRNFGNARATGSISGGLFNDANGDGKRQAGESPLSGRRVYLDLNGDGRRQGTEPGGQSDSAGQYKFEGVAAGNYKVREMLPGGWRETSTARGFHSVRMTGARAVTGKDFGSTQTVLIAGTVFNDRDGDRKKDRDESGLSGRRVYLDADNDGQFDSNERSVLTGSSGTHRFAALPARRTSFKSLPGVGGARRRRAVRQRSRWATAPSRPASCLVNGGLGNTVGGIRTYSAADAAT